MKKALASLVTVSCILLASQAFSADKPEQPKPDNANFEKRKAEEIARIDERIALLQKEKACVSSATNYEEAKACRLKFRAEADALKKSHHPEGKGKNPPAPAPSQPAQ